MSPSDDNKREPVPYAGKKVFDRHGGSSGREADTWNGAVDPVVLILRPQRYCRTIIRSRPRKRRTVNASGCCKIINRDHDGSRVRASPSSDSVGAVGRLRHCSDGKNRHEAEKQTNHCTGHERSPFVSQRTILKDENTLQIIRTTSRPCVSSKETNLLQPV